MGEAIKANPARATRGMDEPTLAQLADGRILVVMRGSNDKLPELAKSLGKSMKEFKKGIAPEEEPASRAVGRLKPSRN